MERDGTFQNNLSWYLKQSGKSQKTLAHELGVHENMITHYVRGRIPVPAEPNYNLRKRLAEYFKVPEETLFPCLQPPNEYRTTITSTPKTVTQSASFVVQSIEKLQTVDEALTKEIHIPSPISLQGENNTDPLDCFAWYSQKTEDIRSLISDTASQAFSCQQIQTQARVEIERLFMPHFLAHDYNEVRISRRMALATLAALSTNLLKKIQDGQVSTLVVEEFLAQCTQSITACHYLLREEGLSTVANILPRYLPTLSLLAEQKTSYQKQAASLAAQGYQLYGLVALHYLRFSERERACHQALRYSRVSGDENLTAYALLNIAGDVKDPGKQLYWYQKTARLLQNISPILRSKVLIGLGKAYARCGQVQEALRHMKQALEVLPVKPEEDETSLYAETMPSLCMWEGLVYLYLGLFASQHDRPYRARVLYHASWNAFAQIETPTIMPVPKRLYIETINLQAEAAIALRDFDSFQKAFLAGVQGAIELGSQKRYKEANVNWKAARQIWNNESKMLDLAEALIEWKPQQIIT